MINVDDIGQLKVHMKSIYDTLILEGLTNVSKDQLAELLTALKGINGENGECILRFIFILFSMHLPDGTLLVQEMLHMREWATLSQDVYIMSQDCDISIIRETTVEWLSEPEQAGKESLG